MQLHHNLKNKSKNKKVHALRDKQEIYENKQTNKEVASKLWIMETIAKLKWMKSPELFLGIFSAKLLFFQLIKTKAIIYLCNKEIEKIKKYLKLLFGSWWEIISNKATQQTAMLFDMHFHGYFWNNLDYSWYGRWWIERWCYGYK